MLTKFFDFLSTLLWIRFLKQYLQKVFSYRSVAPLIIVNLIPIPGVLFLGWSIGTILLLYALENVVIGVYFIFRLIKVEHVSSLYYRLYAVVFFIIHYGSFTIGHIVFVAAFMHEFDTPIEVELSLLFPLAMMFLSHGHSFISNFIGKGEYRLSTIEQQFFKPYGRVVVMHVTIIFGAALALLIGAGMSFLLLLIVSKTLLDVVLHVREHEEYQANQVKDPKKMWEQPLLVN